MQIPAAVPFAQQELEDFIGERMRERTRRIFRNDVERGKRHLGRVGMRKVKRE